MGAGQAVADEEDHQEEKQLCCESGVVSIPACGLWEKGGETNSTVWGAIPPLSAGNTPEAEEGGCKCGLHGESRERL